MTAELETAKLLAPCLYVLTKGGTVTIHHLSKILYVADRSHIAKYGRTITGDDYVAMKNGPVPSRLYDFIKVAKGTSDGAFITRYAAFIPDFLSCSNIHVSAKRSPNMDFLSLSDIEALDEAINMVGQMDFGQRTDFTHDSAWKSVGINRVIPLTEIALAAGANDAMIDYIKAIN